VGSADPDVMVERITHTDTLTAAIGTQRRRIAEIVARESAETLVGRAGGFRVEVMRRLIAPIAHQLAGRFVGYDRAIGETGMHGGAAWIVEEATGGLVITGRETIPASGPLLVVANHPGLSDAVAILAALGRDDAWIVTASYPFLRAMRLASRRFLFVSDDRADRFSAFRRIVARLRAGDTVLVFPAGGLELDPALSPDAALGSLETWSRSVELLARVAPGTRVVPTAIRGVVSRNAFDHTLAKRRTPIRERQRMATLLQLAFRAYRGHPVEVAFAAPLAGDTGDLYAAVIGAMRALIGAA
jgi:hypothetical protein